MIHILQVFHGMDCGGAETMIMNLYRHIDRTKVQFDFLVHTKKNCFFDDEIKRLGGKIYHVPYYKIINEIEYKKELDIFFSNHPEIKIVHGHLGSCAHIYLNIAKKFGCYTIAHSHNTKPHGKSLKHFFYRLFTYKTRNVADYFMGCSKAAIEYRFGEKIANSSKCSILNNAIDVEKFSFSDEFRTEMRNELGLKSNQLVVGHIGRFNEQKNHSFLLDIFKEIHNKNSNSHLLLVGDGILRKKIKEKISALGLEKNVTLTGVRPDVNKILSAMDVFIFPSLYEGLPVTLIEAQFAKLPIICSDNITKEVVITDYVEMLSIYQNKKDWADAALQSINKHKRIIGEKIETKGYDIHESSLFLENFYINKIS